MTLNKNITRLSNLLKRSLSFICISTQIPAFSPNSMLKIKFYMVLYLFLKTLAIPIILSPTMIFSCQSICCCCCCFRAFEMNAILGKEMMIFFTLQWLRNMNS